ncbi:hypothetical protein D3C83_140440 [compost metagenome]
MGAPGYGEMVEVQLVNGQLPVDRLNREEPVASLKGRWHGPIQPFGGPRSGQSIQGDTLIPPTLRLAVFLSPS